MNLSGRGAVARVGRNTFMASRSPGRMYDNLLEVAIQLGLLASYTAIAGVLTVAGLLVEYNGLVTAVAGQYVLGLWMEIVGAALLTFAVLVTRDGVATQYTRLGG